MNLSGGQATVNIPARSISTITVSEGPAATTPPTSTPTTAPTTNPPTGGGTCQVTTSVSAWTTGLVGDITITNTGTSAVNGWSLRFTLGSGQTITSGWNATYSLASGQVTATNVSYNASLPPGGSTTIGFQASHGGNNAAPSGFTLNGTACS
ncbi:cellulose binding domain-containing protein [Plantactinospora solaniradicis]|uniref:Cellulose binding domain-containing protein n=1 Tax=Plantactinospora solaniradicis TaxID=1723736 RepID=A0ABW1KJV9_9ACTN